MSRSLRRRCHTRCQHFGRCSDHDRCRSQSPTTLTVSFLSLNTGQLSTSPQNFAYGSTGYFLRIAVIGSNSAAGCSFAYPNTKPAVPCPTGTISLFDNGSPLKDFLNNGTPTDTTTLNNQGFAEDQPINVDGGTHKITATYSGDGKYATSNSNSLSITITQVPTPTNLTASPSSITSGSSVVLTAVVSSTSGDNPQPARSPSPAAPVELSAPQPAQAPRHRPTMAHPAPPPSPPLFPRYIRRHGRSPARLNIPRIPTLMRSKPDSLRLGMLRFRRHAVAPTHTSA